MTFTESPADRPIVLVVDDTPQNLMLMSALLGEHYRTKVAIHGERALEIASQTPAPDLILLDVVMPGMDGYEVCRRLKANPATAAIPVIFLTGNTDTQDQERAFSVGAVDFITKPVVGPVVLARVRTHVELKTSRDALNARYHTLEELVEARTREVIAIQDVTIRLIGSLAETRDNETGMHLRRTQQYVRALAEDLQRNSPYADQLDTASIDLMTKSAPLHDIGKVGIPDGILLKPGRLTRGEFDVMKTHAQIGARIIASAEEWLGTPSSFLRFARACPAGSHMECVRRCEPVVRDGSRR